jgi:acyl-CoA dehydrogenase
VNVSLGHLQQATMWFMANAMTQPDNAGAGATDYMHLFGLVVLGYMWLRIVKAANEKLKAGAGAQEAALKNKLIVAKFFVERMLPETAAHLARISAGAGSVMEMPVEGF